MKFTAKGCVFVFIICIPFGHVKCQNRMKSPFGMETQHHTRNDSIQSSWSFSFYKKYISPVDGDRCPMRPSCSEYARQAFDRYGFLVGFIMTTDRLTRCGNDPMNYHSFIEQGREYFIDFLQ